MADDNEELILPDNFPEVVQRGVGKVFEWLNWLAIMGALEYIRQKQHSDGIGYIMLWLYAMIGAYFVAFTLHVLENGRLLEHSTPNTRLFASVTCGLLATLVGSLIVNVVVNAFSQGGGPG